MSDGETVEAEVVGEADAVETEARPPVESPDESNQPPAETGSAPAPAAQGGGPSLIKMGHEVGEALTALKEVRQFISEALEEGQDYGEVDGIPKPFLWKPGAEKIVFGFGHRAELVEVDREVDHDQQNTYEEWDDDQNEYFEATSYGRYLFQYKAIIYDRQTGAKVGEGVGSASSLESKYISRPRDSYNTVLKMAKKRALVDAVLSTYALSEMFTQDEDVVEAGGSSSDESRFAGIELTDEIDFGKHEGKTWEEAIKDDKGYFTHYMLTEKFDGLTGENEERVRGWVEDIHGDDGGESGESTDDAKEADSGSSSVDVDREQAYQNFIDAIKTRLEENGLKPSTVEGEEAEWIEAWGRLADDWSEHPENWEAMDFSTAARYLDSGSGDKLFPKLAAAMELDLEPAES